MLKGCLVLVVEDEPLIALDLTLTIEGENGVVVGPCPDLASAMDKAQHAEITVAVLDVDLGGETVFAAADMLVERGIPFVFHTGGGGIEKARERYPLVSVCSKPCAARELIKTLALAANPAG